MSLNQAHLPEFGLLLANAKKITVLTGAGVSAESGIPTFRGQGGLWRTWSAMELATPEAFQENPSLVWEFYHYRRCVVDKALPNAAHYALAALQQRCQKEGKTFTLLTQNIDELHMRAGSEDVVELHGSLWKTRCTKCSSVRENRDMPICAALDGRGAPDPATPDARIPEAELPHCKLCKGLLRPHVVWFGENLFSSTLGRARDALQDCDLLLVAGTSALVWPAAGYAPIVSSRGGKVAEFNIVDTPASPSCKFKFRGPSASTLPEALAYIGNSGGSCSVYFDDQEFVWPKLQVLKDKYLQDMTQLYGMLTERSKLPRSPENLQKLQHYAAVLQRMIPYLMMPKERLPRSFTQVKLDAFEKHILTTMGAFKRHGQTRVQPPLVLPQEQLQSDQAPQPQPAQQEAQSQEQRQSPLSQIEDGIKQMEL